MQKREHGAGPLLRSVTLLYAPPSRKNDCRPFYAVLYSAVVVNRGSISTSAYRLRLLVFGPIITTGGENLL
jgi:hypothetical protein